MRYSILLVRASCFSFPLPRPLHTDNVFIVTGTRKEKQNIFRSHSSSTSSSSSPPSPSPSPSPPLPLRRYIYYVPTRIYARVAATIPLLPPRHTTIAVYYLKLRIPDICSSSPSSRQFAYTSAEFSILPKIHLSKNGVLFTFRKSLCY